MHKAFLKFCAVLFLFSAFCFGQQRLNPTSQINWPQSTGSGAPTLPCTSANFGQPFTDSTNNNQYTCGSSGWFLPKGTAANPAGSNLQIQGNCTGSFCGTGLTFDSATKSKLGAAAVNGVVNPTAPQFAASDLGVSIALASTACGTNCSMTIPPGNYQINVNETAPTGVTINWQQGSVVTIAAGVTWTYNSGIEGHPLFKGPGNVSFATNQTIKDGLDQTWWTGIADGGTNTVDASLGMQYALIAASNINGKGGLINCPQGTYSFRNTPTSFSTSTQNGISIRGPFTTINGGETGCTYKWFGVPGGDILHMIGGHSNRLQNVVLDYNSANTNGSAARGFWIDSANGATGAFTNGPITITNIQEANCVTSLGAAAPSTCGAEVTLSSAVNWTSGTEVTYGGTGIQGWDGVTLPIWYSIDSQHYVTTWYAVNGTLSSAGTGTIQNSGDISDPRINDNAVQAALPPSSGLSCSIASNVLSCTLSSPMLLYPNREIHILNSTDPVYNGYWKMNAVTGNNSFTAPTSANVTEAATTSGTFYGPSEAFGFGSNALALANNSVCCANVSGNIVSAPETYPSIIAGYEQFSSGVGNAFDYWFAFNQTAGSNMMYFGFNKGFTHFIHDVTSHVFDCLYCGLSNGTAEIADGEYENGTPYVYSDGPISGSSQATTRGLNGQFEGNNAGSGGGQTTFIHGLNLSGLTGYGGQLSPDSIAISSGANITEIGDNWGANFGTISGSARGVLTGVTWTNGTGQTPGTYTLTDASGNCISPPVIQAIVGSDGEMDITAGNPNPVFILAQGFGCNATGPVFTLSAGGTPSTFTISVGFASLINVPVLYSNITRSSYTSIGNVYSNVAPGGFAPIGNLSGGTTWIPAFGFGESSTPGPIEAKSNKTSLHTPNLGVAPQTATGLYPLISAETVAMIRCMGLANGAQKPIATAGFIQCQANSPILGAPDPAGGNDTIGIYNGQPALVTPACVTCFIPVEDIAGDLAVPGNLSGGSGGLGNFQNLILDSTFQTPTGGVWQTASGSVGAATLTANTTDVTDPQSSATAPSNTALKAVLPAMTSGQSQGLSQITSTLTAGQTQTLSIFAQSPVAGTNFELQITGVTGCVLPGSSNITVANKWQRFQLTCVIPTTTTFHAGWFTATSNATIYVWGAQLEQSPSAGIPICTTSSTVTGSGVVVRCRPLPSGPSIRSATVTITNPATTQSVTFTTPMSATPNSCSLTPSASAAVTGQPFATSLTPTGFIANVPTTPTSSLAMTYQCVVNNSN